MKKTLALILTVLVAFSMFTFATFAEETTDDILVTVEFVDGNGAVIVTEHLKPGAALKPIVPENPVKEDTAEHKYTFEGWVSNIPGDVDANNEPNLYYQNTVPNLPNAEEMKEIYAANSDFKVVFTATYLEEDVKAGQNLLQFFKSIFDRINLIFQYFATIFDFV